MTVQKQQNNNEVQQSERSFLKKTIVIGFVGGIFWSLISFSAHFFNFTKVNPNLLIKIIFPVGKWQGSWQGFIITLLLYGVISIGLALIYYAMFRKIDSMLPGGLYGIALLLFIMFVLKPIIPKLNKVDFTGKQTLITMVCLFILYGVFIGYSISFQQSELTIYEDKQVKS